ncbi:MAG: hypothetical protein A2527_12450 [Candidatus Lambdaproteobacteria bacterium RIFOXYD2_FULL_50_16]|uniref:FecR protein domain-containing protein n=1 Tax=Candidatus Lambdaproteobacteria bacterium RIFOXYD2_FULL_50_16 TaxID=1817772 RepID=A0A1F6GA94_9PROT|nr:MAG: hypothetical protein A2527_12450 [Candidatus Lambdaproteobacteria bacterium RIFOXYD2_FULL_50_16]
MKIKWFVLIMALALPSLAFGLERVAVGHLIGKPVSLVRDGKIKDLRDKETDLIEGDRIETGPEGKLKLVFETGDVVYLGPDSTLEVSAPPKAKLSLNPLIQLKLTGKLRALVAKRSDTTFRVRTVRAVVGVKGTDFVVEDVVEQTKVSTLKGLVSLGSLKNQQEIDVPAGKSSTVDVMGAIMPLSEIAGDVLQGVEISGKKLSVEEAAGQKVTF